MALASTWIHGNALTMESPEYFAPDGQQTGRLVITPRGWGAEVTLEGHPTVSWMHLPVPSVYESVGRFQRFRLRRVILLGSCVNSTVDSIHIYDGRTRIHAVDQVLEGNFLTTGPGNTIELAQPREVKYGIGVSFRYKTPIGTGPQQSSPPLMTIVAVGAEFETVNILVGTAVSTAVTVVRRFIGGARR
jgi:hypothetical protein